MTDLEVQLRATQQQAQSAREEAQHSWAEVQKMVALLKEEQESGQATREASLLLQQDVNKRMEQYNQLKHERDTFAGDLKKQASDLKEAKVRQANAEEEVKQASVIIAGKPYLL